MKLNHKFVRTVTTTAAVLGAAAMLSVGAFAAEADINDPAAAGYLPPQEQMVQGDIALHSADVAIGEKDHLRRLRRTGGKPHSGQYHADLRR